MSASNSNAASVAKGNNSDCLTPATTQKEFNNQVNQDIQDLKYLFNTTLYTAKAEKNLTMKNGETIKVQDCKNMLKELINRINLHKQAPRSINKRKTQNQNGQAGQGFSKQKVYNQDFCNFWKSARDSVGQIDINLVNQIRQEETNEQWIKKGGEGAVNPVPPVVVPNPNALSKDGKTYITDHLSFINGYNFNKQLYPGISSASILTALNCIYTNKTGMQGLAKPPAPTAAFLKQKYIIKEVKKSEAFKLAKKAARDAGEPEPTVTAENYMTYADNTPAGQVLKAEIAAIQNDNSATACWRNGAYLGATSEMRKWLGDKTFKELNKRDAEKAKANQEGVANGTIEPEKERNMVEKPVATVDYFPFSSLQTITSINSIPEDKIPANNPITKLLQPGDEYDKLKNQLAVEAEFLSAVLEALKSPRYPGNHNRTKNNIGKHAKKRVMAQLASQQQSS